MAMKLGVNFKFLFVFVLFVLVYEQIRTLLSSKIAPDGREVQFPIFIAQNSASNSSTSISEDLMTVWLDDAGKIVADWGTRSDKLEDEFDFERYVFRILQLGWRPLRRTNLVWSHSSRHFSFYSKILRSLESITREEIMFVTTSLEEEEREIADVEMNDAIDFFLETNRVWTVSMDLNQEESRLEYALNPISAWKSDEIAFVRLIDSIQFPSRCGEREVVRYRGSPQKEGVASSIFTQLWAFVQSLDQGKTLYASMEEDLTASKCANEGGMSCWFLPITRCNETLENSKSYNGFNPNVGFESSVLSSKFQDQYWLLSHLIRFSAFPNGNIRRNVEKISKDAKEFSPCVGVYASSKEEFVKIMETQKQSDVNKVFLISEDYGEIGNYKQYINFFVPPKVSEDETNFILSKTFAAVQMCDSFEVSDSNMGRFIKILSNLKTEDQDQWESPQLEEVKESPLPTSQQPNANTNNCPSVAPTGGELSRPRYNRTKVATIIEERPLNWFVPLVTHFLSVVPPDWPFVIWASNRNIDMLKSSHVIRREMDLGRLEIKFIPENTPLTNGELVSRFLTKPWFWEQFEAEWILFFQTDSMLCSRSPISLDEWIGYDWVGAPWPHNPVPGIRGGNGGLSMRRKGAMLDIIRKHPRVDGDQPEDVWFAQRLAEYGGNVPENQVAAKFAVENPYIGHHPQTPLGMHRGGLMDHYTTHADKQWMEEYCPETRMFQTLIR